MIIAKEQGSFKRKLQENNHLLGTFIQIGHPAIAEFVGSLGFDFVILDSEHSAMNIETIQLMLQGLKSTSAYGVVRIPAIRYEYIAGCLDSGADAILVPQVRNAEDMEMIKNAALYPPSGKRGIGPGRATDYGASIMSMKEDSNRNTVIMIQVENEEAIHNLDEILSFDFFDLVFIGPGDLSMSLGIFGEFQNPLLLAEIKNIIVKSKKWNKKIMMFATNAEIAANCLTMGVDFVVLDSELGMIAQTARIYIQAFKTQIKEIQAI